MIEIFVPGEPIAQPRQNFRIMWPAAAKAPKGAGYFEWMKKNAYVTAYHVAHAVDLWKEEIRMAAGFKMRDYGPFSGPIKATLTFGMPLRKSNKRKVNLCDWHKIKPDLDNLEKAVLDALSGVVYEDDKQVCWVTKGKFVVGDSSPCGLFAQFEKIDSVFERPLDEIKYVTQTGHELF